MEKLKAPCIVCGTRESEMWWKCCPAHCTEQGQDVVCADCVTTLHGLCIMQGCSNLGSKAVEIKFGCFEDDGFKVYADTTRKVFLCHEHINDIVILEPQY